MRNSKVLYRIILFNIQNIYEIALISLLHGLLHMKAVLDLTKLGPCKLRGRQYR